MDGWDQFRAESMGIWSNKCKTTLPDYLFGSALMVAQFKEQNFVNK